MSVADIFRDYGPAWRKANAGHLSLGQLKAMAAIEVCRTAEPGGHVAALLLAWENKNPITLAKGEDATAVKP